jgi:hypothetical protein
MTNRSDDTQKTKLKPDEEQFREHHGEPMSDEEVARAGETDKPKSDAA